MANKKASTKAADAALNINTANPTPSAKDKTIKGVQVEPTIARVLAIEFAGNRDKKRDDGTFMENWYIFHLENGQRAKASTKSWANMCKKMQLPTTMPCGMFGGGQTIISFQDFGFRSVGEVLHADGEDYVVANEGQHQLGMKFINVPAHIWAMVPQFAAAGAMGNFFGGQRATGPIPGIGNAIPAN